MESVWGCESCSAAFDPTEVDDMDDVQCPDCGSRAVFSLADDDDEEERLRGGV